MRFYILAALFFSFAAQAQIGWQVRVDSAAPFAAREPMTIDLTTGNLAINTEQQGGTVCSCPNGPCPVATPGAPRPYFFLLDGRWYNANIGMMEFYRTAYVADQVQLGACSRPGGIGPIVTQNLLLTNSGTQLLYLSASALIEQKQGVRVSDGAAISYLVLRTPVGDVRCAAEIASPLVSDTIFKNGFE